MGREQFVEGYARLYHDDQGYSIIAWHSSKQQWFALYHCVDLDIAEQFFGMMKQGKQLRPNYLFSEPVQDTAPNQTDVYVYLKGY